MVEFLPYDGVGLQAEGGVPVGTAGLDFFDDFESGMMAAYYERATAGDWNVVSGAGYHTPRGLYIDGLNYMWTVPGSGFSQYPDSNEWVLYLFTIDEWGGDDQIWFPTFGDPSNEASRGPAYEIQFNLSVETFRIQARDNNDDRYDVATDAESNQSYPWLSTGTAYAAGIHRSSTGILGGLWEADAAYPDQTEALAIIDSNDHPNDDGSTISGLGPGDGPGRWGFRTGSNTSVRVHEVERVPDS